MSKTYKKVIVIGGNGFIGRNLCKTLLREGYDVFSFDIEKPEERNTKIHYISGDFFDDDNLKDAISGKDIIIHAISTVNPGNSNKRYMQGYSRDFVQSVRLCSMIIENKQKMIFISSGGTVYGNQERQPIKETAYPLPINHYGSVKLCIESVIRTFNTQLHTKMLIARVSNPFGPGQDYHKGVGFVDAALKKAIRGEPIEIWGDGENVRDYIFIEDVCGMIVSLIDYSGPLEVFNVSSDEGVSQNMVIESLRKIGLDPAVTYKDARSVDVRRIILSNQRILQVYDRPLHSFQEGIQKYHDFLVEKGFQNI